VQCSLLKRKQNSSGRELGCHCAASGMPPFSDSTLRTGCPTPSGLVCSRPAACLGAPVAGDVAGASAAGAEPGSMPACALLPTTRPCSGQAAAAQAVSQLMALNPRG
jgi:hypothetical protein